MKKFIVLKMNNDIEVTNRVAPIVESEAPLMATTEPKKNSNIQPPLPLDPPPPDEPLETTTNISVDSYDSTQEKKSEVLQTNDILSKETKKVPLCRDFIRGTCDRLKCKFLHEYDVSQTDLIGVYTFCRKYQTAVCTYQRCKFVHATIFEEQHFYRTGELPPRAFAHINNNTLLQPPPPPPPPPEEQPTNFRNPPPPIKNDIEKQQQQIVNNASMPITKVPSLQERFQNATPLRSSPPLKREWSSVEPFSKASPNEIDGNGPILKKCKNCHFTEIRCEDHKEKVEKMKHEQEDLDKKIAMLDRKTEKLNTIILTLLKST